MQSLIPPNFKTPAFEDYISFEEAFPDDFISDLMRSYPALKENRDALEDGLKFVHRVFVTEKMQRDSYVGVASKESTARLHAALNTALNELRAPEMWSRLRAANAIAFPSTDGAGLNPEKHFVPMITALDDLAAIVKASLDIDGKAIHQNRRRRTDLKGAASALFYFWELCGGKSAVWEGYGRESESHSFIMECLLRLDNNAKESSIRDFLTAEP